jgi:hypothetical protein
VKTPNRIAVALHLRDLESKIFPMAKAAGIEPPQLELRYADGLTRAEARALYHWGLRVPGLVRVLEDRAHADHGAVRAFRDLVNYFQFDHPQIGDTPAEWGGQPLSAAMRGFLLGTRPAIEASELDPGEAAGFLAYAETQPEYQAAFLDGDSPQHEAISAEIEVLNARAAEALTSTPAEEAAAAPPPPEAPEHNMAQPTERITEINRLLRDTKMSAPDRRELVNELAGLLEGHSPGQALPPPAPTPKPGTPPEVTVTAPRGSGLTEKSIALTEELRGMKFHGSSERQAKLAELAETLLDAEPTGEAA